MREVIDPNNGKRIELILSLAASALFALFAQAQGTKKLHLCTSGPLGSSEGGITDGIALNSKGLPRPTTQTTSVRYRKYQASRPTT